jgi:outer membrane lipoprotein SlyB
LGEKIKVKNRRTLIAMLLGATVGASLAAAIGALTGNHDLITSAAWALAGAIIAAPFAAHILNS